MDKVKGSLRIGLAVALLGLAVAPAEAQRLSGEEIIDALRDGGYVIVMRHAPASLEAARNRGGGGGGGGFGQQQQIPLSEDAKSHLRGQLVTLRQEIQRVLPRTNDRATQLHLQGSLYRIGRILDPRD